MTQGEAEEWVVAINEAVRKFGKNLNSWKWLIDYDYISGLTAEVIFSNIINILYET
jgi:hypothetical protein